MTTLNGKQKRYLRGLGHHLDVVVQLGRQGVSDALVQACDEALEQHELIKVRRGGDCPASRREVAEALAERLGAGVAQELGHTVLLYRRRAQKPTIELP